MKLFHFLAFMFFVSILAYLGLKNGTATVNILNSGQSGLVKETATLQGR